MSTNPPVVSSADAPVETALFAKNPPVVTTHKKSKGKRAMSEITNNNNAITTHGSGSGGLAKKALFVEVRALSVLC